MLQEVIRVDKNGSGDISIASPSKFSEWHHDVREGGLEPTEAGSCPDSATINYVMLDKLFQLFQPVSYFQN